MFIDAFHWVTKALVFEVLTETTIIFKVVYEIYSL